MFSEPNMWQGTRFTAQKKHPRINNSTAVVNSVDDVGDEWAWDNILLVFSLILLFLEIVGT